MEYPARIYDFGLQAVALVVGLLILAGHLVALLRPEQTKQWLLRFPRSRMLGFVLLAIDAIWFFWLMSNVDLEDFAKYRHLIQIAIPVLAVLSALFVPEFLAVRALGIMALLAGEPILSAAFLRPEPGRLLLVIVAYIWLTLGLIWVASPYLLRDQITWVTKTANRFRTAALCGVACGVAVLAFGIMVRG
jgi:hypothetical protein